MHYRCLIIDDDLTIAETTAEFFNLYDIKTAFVTSGSECFRFLESNTASLLLLDINLGEGSGFELCKRLREEYDMPILFISARQSDDDVLTALNIGGDDYIKKPYTLSIMLAKVRAVLGRYEKTLRSAPAEEDKGRSGEITICKGTVLDTYLHRLIKNGETVTFKAMEYKMLVYLLENRGRVVTKDELLENVWEDTFIGEGTLPVHIRHLREKIERDPNDPKLIKTVWGVGYIFEQEEGMA